MTSTAKRKVALQRGRSDAKPQHYSIELDFNRQVFHEEAEGDWQLRRIKKVWKRLLPFSYGLSVALNIALLMVPNSMSRRGYFAIGGEWLLIMVMGFIAYKAAKHFQKGSEK